MLISIYFLNILSFSLIHLGRTQMKVHVCVCLLLAPIFCFANPSPFGLEVGKMTVKEFKEMYLSKLEGSNQWVGGEIYRLSPKKLDFEGLKKVEVIFDNREILVAVFTELNKERFSSILTMLQSKYKQIDSSLPRVGNKSASFSDSDIYIYLLAPHLSFVMEMNYITKDFMGFLKNQIDEKTQNVRKNEESKL